jgi:hypothetical protein
MGLGYEESWTQLRRELEDVGLPLAAITEHKEYIINWFREAIAKAALEDAVGSVSGGEDTDSVSDEGNADLVCNGDGILLAAKEGRLNSLKNLIAADVDLHYCDPITGENAFHIAAQYGKWRLLGS